MAAPCVLFGLDDGVVVEMLPQMMGVSLLAVVGRVLLALWDALQQEKCVVREVTGARCRPNTPQTPPNSFKVRVEAPRCKKKQKNSKRTSKSIVL